MAALTSDRQTPRRDGDLLAVGVAANTTVYKGALACLNVAGWAVPGADTVGYRFVGVTYEKGEGSGTNGAVKMRVFRRGIFSFAASGADQTWVGRPVYISDDQTVALKSGVTNDIPCGRIVEVVSSTEVFVDIGVTGIAHEAEQAWGETVFTGSLQIDTGLRIVDDFQLTLQSSAAPGAGGDTFTWSKVANSAGLVTLHGWKRTSAADNTLIAATNSARANWHAWGI